MRTLASATSTRLEMLDNHRKTSNSTVGKFSDFKLPLKSLPEGTHQFHYDLDKQFFANMESADIRDAKVGVELTVVHRNGAYDLTFACNGSVIVACDRCLDDLELPIETSYHVTVKYGDEYREDSDEFIEIPESDNYLNVAYMIYDTVSLAIPIKHVHPMGKCNRAMSSLLKKHRSHVPNDPDADLEDELIDEMEAGDFATDNSQDDSPTDPRWDALKNFGADE
jgi:uncharacterized metal-binding protein YceD (DUF177 family)